MAPAQRSITIQYAPRRVFLPLHDREQRWAAIVAHRRCGKTVACINDQIRRAIMLDRPDGRFAYIAPLFNQAKDVAWTYLKQYAAPLLAGPPNETELRVDLLNGARIRLYGADNPDRLRGIYLDGVVLDEFADMAPSVWGEVVRPLLSDRQGWATFIGTPRGHNQFYDVFDRASREPAEWLALKLRASETGILLQSELDAARRDMTPEQYEQEFECSFEAAIVGAYYGRDMAELDRQGRIAEVEAEVSLPVHTAWDLGIGDSTAIWFWQMVGNEIRVIDHYEASGRGIDHYAEVIHAKDYRRGIDYVPHDARVRELGSGRTRLETMRALRLNPKVVEAQKIMDGINAVRLTLPRCWFDRDRCKKGIEALKQYRADYDDKTRAFKDTPKHDWTSHSSDAFRYLCLAWREIAKVEEPKRKPSNISEMSLNDLWATTPKPGEERI